jgi:uncharacterized protein (DUF433 family)
MANENDAIVMGEDGTPMIAGTQVPVQRLLEHLQSGGTLTAFGDQHPEVDPDTAVRVMELALKAMEGEGEA